MPATDRFLALSDDALLSECAEQHLRGSGPGGQKRNKTSSSVRLTHRPTGISVLSGEDRSQRVNKARALRRLRAAIAVGVRSEVSLTAFVPSETLRGVIGPGRGLRLGTRDPRFWRVVAEVLDVLQATRGSVRLAAEALRTTTASLVKFLATDRTVWAESQRLREASGLRPLGRP